MATFEDPVRDALEAREALRGLAYATRHPPNRIEAYQTLESLHWAASALQTTLEQMAEAYRGYAGTDTLVGGDAAAGAKESNKIGSRLNKASRNMRRAAELLTEAWNLDGHTDHVTSPPPGRTAWQFPVPPPSPPPSSRPSPSRPGAPSADRGGLGL
ncbi:hypothetical protein SAMN04488563_5456 [Jiangella alkaliphila]|uniref:Uncharacterized protein n=1 Tax=Jiangella alkaliphila TaxID=419479 RepID=A0A1H2L8Q0_9ACTN|nr:hypothetical protein SAMN04488563_5456 [Jiangella alkaliphila]